MANLVMKSEVDCAPELLWDYLKSFSVIGEWNPLVKSIMSDGDVIGSIRTITFPEVGDFVERLDNRDEDERVCTYSIIESPFNIDNCIIQIRVKDSGSSSQVEWGAEFTADPEQELVSVTVFQTLYQKALDNLSLTMIQNMKGKFNE